MQYRNATIEDLPTIVEIYNSTIEGRLATADTEKVSVQSKEPWFYEHNEITRPLWMIEDDEKKCIGWVSFQNFYGRPAYSGTAELSIYLHENYRGKGFGEKIIDHCINEANALKIHSLLGFIFAHNEPSIKLFLNAGFEEWAHLKDIAFMDNSFYSLKILGRKV